MNSKRSSEDPSLLLSWLQLLRLPAVFTALADVCCGYLVTHPELLLPGVLSDGSLFLLLTASGCLYLSGMVFNDVFDARLDAVERPERPIPRGRITQRAAAAAGGCLMAIGLLTAWWAGELAGSGRLSGAIAGLLAAAVLAYDAYFKKTAGGPVAMGACRLLNVLLGGCLGAGLEQIISFDFPVAGIAFGLGVYVAGVTIVARNETGTASRGLLMAGFCIAVTGIGIDAVVAVVHQPDMTIRVATLVQLAAIVAVTVIRGRAAMRNCEPQILQRTVGKMLLWIIVLDAVMTFAITGQILPGVLVLMLVIPAGQLRRRIPMS